MSHDMEKLSASLALCEANAPITSGFPHKGPVMRTFHVFFVVSLNKRIYKQSSCRLKPQYHSIRELHWSIVDPTPQKETTQSFDYFTLKKLLNKQSKS